MTNKKKCPMCAEEIPIASVTCEYCGAHFEVTSTGYCQNCHQVRDADGNGQCKICGNAVVDLRVESRFVEEPVQELLPVSQPIAQTRITKTGKSRLTVGILAAILVPALIGAVVWFGLNSLPAVSSLFATVTPTATTASTPTATPTVTPTRTARPTPTMTPIPLWVTNFAEPILTAIKDREPDFSDDFSTHKGWESWIGGSGQVLKGTYAIQNGAMHFEFSQGDAGFEHRALRHRDFVLKVDAKMIQGEPGSAMNIFFRGGSGHWYCLFLNSTQNVWAINKSWDAVSAQTLMEGSNHVSPPGGTTHVTLIAKGTRLAVYLNDMPVAFLEDPDLDAYTGDNIWFMNYYPHPIDFEFDNVKFWNLDKVLNLP